MLLTYVKQSNFVFTVALCNWWLQPVQICNIFLFKIFGDEAALYNMEDVQLQDFGTFKEVIVTKDDTLLMKVNCDTLFFVPCQTWLLPQLS